MEDVVVVMRLSSHRSLPFQNVGDHIQVMCHMYMCKELGQHLPYTNALQMFKMVGGIIIVTKQISIQICVGMTLE